MVIWGLGCLSLSYRFFPHIMATKKINLLILLVGFLFAFFQPEIDLFELSTSWKQTFSGAPLASSRLQYISQTEFDFIYFFMNFIILKI